MNATGADSPRAADLREILNAMLEERNKCAARVQGRRDKAKAAKASVNSFVDAATVDGNEEDEKRIVAIDRQFVEELEKNRPRIRRWFGRTISLPAGVIKWRTIPRALDVPEDDSELIARILKRPDADELLITYYKLNRRRLAALSRWAQRRLGISSYRQEHLTIKPTGSSRPIVLSRRRFTATPHIQD